jgi:hypothetical protein
MNAKWARPWFGATALAVLVGIVIQAFVTANTAGRFNPATARVLNLLAFFTIESNLIVGATSLLLALRPDRRSTLFRTFWLIGVVAIALTGIVYHVALRGLFDLDSWAQAADVILHTAVPILAVLGWLMFGPRGCTSPGIVRLTVLFPACYMAFTLVRGAFIHWYPYPFADVDALGYGRVITNSVWISLLFVGLGAGAHALDQRLSRQAPPARTV